MRERSFSVGTKRSPLKDSLTASLSTPNISSPPSANTQLTNHISTIAAYSMEGLDSSGILYQQQLLNSIEESRQDNVKSNKETKLNWRLVYNPKCFILGLATLAYVSGLSVTYQCIPPLGESSGKLL